MNSDDSDADREQVHRGHDLEAGLLARVREWTDVFPWLRLGRTLRVAGSPPLVLLMAFTFAVWWLGHRLILGDASNIAVFSPTDHDLNRLSDVPRRGIGFLASYIHGLNPISIFDLGTGSLRWYGLLGMFWTLLVWTPAAMLLARQGALLTAGRSMVGLKPGISHVISRTPAAWLAAIVPLACVFAIGLLIIVLGWVSRMIDGIQVFEFMLAVIVALIAIPCGVLAFGANVAVPLSWAALINEGEPDTLDSLSRGYEYLFRRPLRLVTYVAVSLAILIVVGFLASAVAWAASSVAASMLNLAGSPINVPRMVIGILRHLPAVVVMTVMWSLVGGVYLLLRYDAGGQEVEDLWQPTRPAKPSFPKLPEAND